MNYDEFAGYIKDCIMYGCKEGVEVLCQSIIKNNGVARPCLSVREKGAAIAPVIYLDDYYEQYMHGRPVDDIAKHIINMIIEDGKVRKEHALAGDYFTRFENIKDMVFFKVVNYEKNRELLSGCPHHRFFDLAITYRFAVEIDDEKMKSALITNDMLAGWGINEKELMLTAKENTPKMFPPNIIDMNSFLASESLFSDIDGFVPLTIATNVKMLNGAGVIFYEGLLKSFCLERYYILPSSIHEVILVPEKEIGTPEELTKLVKHVNTVLVDEEEVLSDSVYIYDPKSDMIVRIHEKDGILNTCWVL